MWGYPVFVLGAISSFLEPFRGHLSPKIDKVSEEMTLRYHHEEPWVGEQLPSEYGTHKTVKTSIWPGVSGREREIFIDGLLVRILSGESPYGRGSARAEDVQGTPTQSHVSPSML